MRVLINTIEQLMEENGETTYGNPTNTVGIFDGGILMALFVCISIY